MSNESIRIRQVNTVILSVTDQDRSIAFYVDVLGMEKRVDIPFGNGDRWIEVAPAGAETSIAVARPPAGRQPKERGATCVSFVVDDVDAMHETLRKKGVDVDAEVMRGAPPVPPMFFFRDPDGNPLLIVGRM